MLRASASIGTTLACLSAILAQSQPPASPEFNAASIKPKQSVGCSAGCGVRFTPGMVSSFPGGATARAIVMAAYHLSPYQLSGGPGWLDSDMFDLEAKADPPVDESQLRLMLQAMLSRRFQLVAHHESREVPVYALTVGKNGVKPHEIKEGDPRPSQPEKFVSSAAALPGTPAPTLLFRTINQFAAASESNPLASIGRPVIDKTGLQGRYFFTFSWDPKEDYMGAVEEQLGLKFVARKASLDFLVIDHIEKPEPN